MSMLKVETPSQRHLLSPSSFSHLKRKRHTQSKIARIRDRCPSRNNAVLSVGQPAIFSLAESDTSPLACCASPDYRCALLLHGNLVFVHPSCSTLASWSWHFCCFPSSHASSLLALGPRLACGSSLCLTWLALCSQPAAQLYSQQAGYSS